MRFYSLYKGYMSNIRYGSGVKLFCKLDCGALCTLVNLYALSKLLDIDKEELRKKVRTIGYSCIFYGYNGAGTECYVCRIRGLNIDGDLFNDLFIVVDLTELRDEQGKLVPKILIGQNLLVCCDGSIGFGAIGGYMFFNVADISQHYIFTYKVLTNLSSMPFLDEIVK